MNQIIPPKFLFRWSFVARKIEKLPRGTGRLLELPNDCVLPSLAELDQRQDFATVKLGWNDSGFAINVDVSGRSGRPEFSSGENVRPDGVWLWIDTRNTQSVHRATRFCHHFVAYPLGSGPKRSEPSVRSLPVARAREESPLPNVELAKIQADVSNTGYWIDAWFPKEILVGFDPSTHGQIGFHYIIHDSQLGDQTLAVGTEFPCESDPSLWQTVELIG